MSAMQRTSEAPDASVKIRVWDAPVRLFHWLLVALVALSVSTGYLGGNLMQWHIRSGCAILGLLIFRLLWGFAGSGTARFANFVRGPRAALYGSDAIGGVIQILTRRLHSGRFSQVRC